MLADGAALCCSFSQVQITIISGTAYDNRDAALHRYSTCQRRYASDESVQPEHCTKLRMRTQLILFSTVRLLQVLQQLVGTPDADEAPQKLSLSEADTPSVIATTLAGGGGTTCRSCNARLSGACMRVCWLPGLHEGMQA